MIDHFKGRLENKHTRDSYNSMVTRFFEWCGNGNGDCDVNQTTVENFIDYLKHENNLSPGTLNVAASALRKYGKIKGVRFDVTNVPKVVQNSPETLSEEEIITVIDHITDPRDKAMIALLYDSALRISELVALNCDDVDLDGQLIHLSHRKMHNAPQAVPFGKKTKKILIKYFDERSVRGFGDRVKNPELFIGAGSRIHANTVRMHIGNYSERFIGKRIAPHQLRHSRATHLRNSGVSIEMLREFLGHSSISSTMIYARLSPIELQKQLRKIGEI